MADTVVLANGSFPVHTIPLQRLDHASRVICCDGAAESLLAYGREPDVIVGDLDSLPAALATRFAAKVLHKPDQETNDLTKAVKLCVGEQIEAITILGATGKREDHTVGNLGLLAEYTEWLDAEMVTDYGIFRVMRDTRTFASSRGQQISVVSLTPGVPVTAQGLKYPIEQRCLTALWQGTLNEAVDDVVTLSCHGGRLLVFQCFLR